MRATEPLLAELKKPTIVVGALGAERARVLLAVITKYAGEIILVSPMHERACSVDEMKSLIPKSYPGKISISTVADLFPQSGECRVVGQVVVMGSLYLVGEVLARYEGKSALHTTWQDKLNVKP